jgi:hypothetical protein
MRNHNSFGSSAISVLGRSAAFRPLLAKGSAFSGIALFDFILAPDGWVFQAGFAKENPRFNRHNVLEKIRDTSHFS